MHEFLNLLAQVKQESWWWQVLQSYAVMFGCALVGAISFGIAVLIMLKFFTWATVEIDEWEEVKKGNMSIAVILGAVIIGASVVVSLSIKSLW